MAPTGGERLGRDDWFNAGTHRMALRMSWSDYARVAAPEVLDLSRHDAEREHRGPR